MRSIHKLGQLSAGQVLRADGLISTAQLQEIHDEQAATRESVVEIAMARGLVTEFDVAKADGSPSASALCVTNALCHQRRREDGDPRSGAA